MALLPSILLLILLSMTETKTKKKTKVAQQVFVLPEGSPLTPRETLDELKRLHDKNKNDDHLLVVDTHGHTHLDEESKEQYRLDDSSNSENSNDSNAAEMLCLTCAVQEADWQSCLDYVAQSSQYRTAALGIHPWYLHDLNIEDDLWVQRLQSLLEQNPNIMVGEIGLCKMARFVRTYPKGKTAALELQRHVFVQQMKLAAQYQRPVSVHCVQQQGVLLETLKELAQARITTTTTTTTHKKNDATTQTTALEKEEEEAAGVGAAEKTTTGATDPFAVLPTAIALHSFTGTAHQVQQLLEWEERLRNPTPASKKGKRRKNKGGSGGRENNNNGAEAIRNAENDNPSENQGANTNSTTPTTGPLENNVPSKPQPPLLYFGFSDLINHDICSSEKSQRQTIQAIRAVPENRLMVESDVHARDSVMGGSLAALAFLAWALERPISEVAQLTLENAQRFFALVRASDGDTTRKTTTF